MKNYFIVVVAVTMVILTVAAGACKTNTISLTTSTAKPGSGAVINSDSIVIVQIQTITAQSAGYPWKLNVLIRSTTNVGDLPNPVANSIGSVVTVFTDQDMSTYKVNDAVTAKIKYVGDVNIPAGISLYMYKVALEIQPGY